jgi:nicotinamidase-related amidase
MRIVAENTIAVLIDVQDKLFPHMDEKGELELNLSKLLEGMCILKIPVIVTEQYSRGLGTTILSLKNIIPSVMPIEKMSFSCCDNPVFLNHLKLSGKENVILCGIETHVCVLQTAIDLVSLGFQPVIVEDCVSSRKRSDKQIAIARIRQEGALSSSVESLLFEITRTSLSEVFKPVSKLVK